MTRSQVKGIQLGRILAGEAHADVIYFLAMSHQGREAVKIGTTTRLLPRINRLSYAATLADVLLLLPGGLASEAAWHSKFRVCRIDGYRELFWLKGPLKDFLNWSPPRVRPAVITGGGDPRGEPVSISEAVEGGHAPGATVQALRQDRYLSDKGQFPDGLVFPKPVAEVRSGQTERFWSAEITEFNEARRGRRVA